jgi:hypothetical protein
MKRKHVETFLSVSHSHWTEEAKATHSIAGVQRFALPSHERHLMKLLAQEAVGGKAYEVHEVLRFHEPFQCSFSIAWTFDATQIRIHHLLGPAREPFFRLPDLFPSQEDSQEEKERPPSEPDVHQFLTSFYDSLPTFCHTIMVLCDRDVRPVFSATQPAQTRPWGEAQDRLPSSHLYQLRLHLFLLVPVYHREYARIVDLVKSRLREHPFLVLEPLVFRRGELKRLLVGTTSQSCLTCKRDPNLRRLGYCPECQGTRVVFVDHLLPFATHLPVASLGTNHIFPTWNEELVKDWPGILKSSCLRTSLVPAQDLPNQLSQLKYRGAKTTIQDQVSVNQKQSRLVQKLLQCFAFQDAQLIELQPPLETILLREIVTPLGASSLASIWKKNDNLLLLLDFEKWEPIHNNIAQPRDKSPILCSSSSMALSIQDQTPSLVCGACKGKQEHCISIPRSILTMLKQRGMLPL